MSSCQMFHFLRLILLYTNIARTICALNVMQEINSRKLLAVPNSGILKNVTDLDLSYNKIETINSTIDFLDCYQLINLYMNYNNLTAFPFLLNIANTLTSIYLSFNRINIVEPAYLTILQKLQMITMRNNLITSFPDVYMSSLNYLGLRYNLFSSFPNWPIIGKNLTNLYLSGNKITSISVSSLLKLSKIKFLSLEEMDLQTIPNWCSLPKNANIGINLPSSLYCDCRMNW